MTIKLAAGCAAATLGLVLAGAASAHHSFSMYDNDHQIEITGTATAFQWQNPHVYIEIDTPEAPKHHYTIECSSPGILSRTGWKFNMIKPGDKLSLIVAPMRDGTAVAALKQLTLPDGRKLGNGPRNNVIPPAPKPAA